MIEVGEYVRTEDGYIEKIKTIVCNDYPIKELRNRIILTDKSVIEVEDILKHSKNIIELIEVGDYVNGEKINSFRAYDNKKHAVVENSEDQLEYCFDNEDIKSIVTKEQYEAIEYKLEE